MIALLMVALLADPATPPQPDYSQDALLSVLRVYADDHRPPVPRERHFHRFYVEWHALGMDWRLFYLPLLPPLSGSGPSGAAHFPNPFKLTGTFASTMPPMFEKDRPRDVEREFKRIQKLKVKPE